MARKPQSFKLNEAKKEIILYQNVEQTPAEKSLIDFYLRDGYSPKMETKKKNITVKEMKDELKANPEQLKLFEEAYKEKNGFHKACRIYSAWKKSNK